MRGFAENLETGVYGKLPNDAHSPIASMQEISVRSLLMIENLMVWSKHELKSFAIKKETVPFKETKQEIQSFLKRNLSLKTTPSELYMDRRYGRLLLENLIFAAFAFEESPTFTWSDSTLTVALTSPLSLETEDLSTTLFQENAPHANEIILSLATAQLIATYHDFAFNIENTRNHSRITVTYETK